MEISIPAAVSITIEIDALSHFKEGIRINAVTWLCEDELRATEAVHDSGSCYRKDTDV